VLVKNTVFFTEKPFLILDFSVQSYIMVEIALVYVAALRFSSWVYFPQKKTGGTSLQEGTGIIFIFFYYRRLPTWLMVS